MDTGMTWADQAAAIAALVGLALFLAVLIWFVSEPALIVVCALTVALAAFDFVRTAFLGKA